MADAAVAAIQFALETDEGLAFLRCWNEGDFSSIREEWPEAPEDIFIGVDPLHVNRSKYPDPDIHNTLSIADFDAK